jgi:uroporphyrinogen decarboxylase
MSKGNRCDIENEVKRCISSLAPGGGFICAPSHHIQDDVPPANVLALRDSVVKWGKYPIMI